MKTNGPGEYDHEATLVRAATGAQGVVLVIVAGDRGSGFSVQGPEAFVRALPDVLEQMARDIRAQNDLGVT